eukprot:TRINITY_DN57819_c0_g1_i1.p1 TRINITY_DN57819_c0_g1~~TRINITY_DN57819_c0_g1_i1.p1  ORF type:complete len:212 (-),score=2.01 TRINITY_DN57819_c0_g1_i1:551-1117(-)
MAFVLFLNRIVSSKGWLWYEKKLANSPVLTKCITRGACFLVGDSVAQQIEITRKGEGAIDTERLAAYTLWSSWFALPYHVFFNVMHKMTLGYRPLVSAAIGTVANTGLFVPLCMYPTLYFSTGLMRGKSLQECTEHMKQTFLTVYIADMAFWVPVEMVLLYYVPLRHRVFAFSSANTAFAVICSAIIK